ncbi:MAG: hypothetical protein WEA09_02790 [Gemmatimonadota bacterium]
MTCERARELLWPPEQPRLAEKDFLEARSHVDDCESCQEFLALDATLIQAYRRAPAIQAPPAVRERVFDALAQARLASSSEARNIPPRGLFMSRWGMALPMGAAALLLVSVFAHSHLTSNPLGDAESADLPTMSVPVAAVSPLQGATSPLGFVEDFQRRELQAQHLRTSKPQDVVGFLRREFGLDSDLAVTSLPLPELEVVGVEVCIIEGVRGAMVTYKQAGRVVYHHYMRTSGGTPSPPSLARVENMSSLTGATTPSIVNWESEDGLKQVLVADLAPEDLLALARRSKGE